jgi:hypothetical protein
MPLRDEAEWAEEYDLPAHDIRAIQRDAWEAAKEAAANELAKSPAPGFTIRIIRALPFPGGEKKGEG